VYYRAVKLDRDVDKVVRAPSFRASAIWGKHLPEAIIPCTTKTLDANLSPADCFIVSGPAAPASPQQTRIQ
jgi:hypothetical protein